MGYRVGANGLDEENRRAVLDYVFNKEVPRVQSEEHMIEWDVPLSSARLKKMANCIATFCRNARRRESADMEDAIKNWEADLEYLRINYHVGKFDFIWPTSESPNKF